MNFKAKSVFKPADLVKAQNRFVPIIVDAITEGCAAVVGEAQAIVPVDTGELQASIHTASVELRGTVVTGTVEASADHAGYVEFGTGIRGASSPDAGAGPYSPTWPGQMAQPYMRPAVVTAEPAIKEAFRKRGFKL